MSDEPGDAPVGRLRVGVVGAGTMGLGIAYVCVAAGLPTWTVEVAPARREEFTRQVAAAVEIGRARGRLTDEQAAAVPELLTVVAAVEDLPTGLDVVVETVNERVDLKHDVLAAALTRDPALLATNTSSLSVDDLAEGLSDPGRLLGLHFFNPVWSIALVEVVRGRASRPEVLELASRFVDAIGKQRAVVADTPGFATSRLDLVASLEAMRMVEEGVGSAEDIDRAVNLAYRHPVGPLRLSDIVGLDVRLDIARQLERSLGARFRPPQILVDLVDQGHLGKKSGRGFHEWEVTA